MKVGDIVRCVRETPGTVGWMEKWVHMIVGPGTGDWDWELYHAGNDCQKPFTWMAVEEELELINEGR